MILNFADWERYCIEHRIECRAYSPGEWEALHHPKDKSDKEPPPPLRLIEHANRELFKRYCKADGIDPEKTLASPLLLRLLTQQRETRAALDDETET